MRHSKKGGHQMPIENRNLTAGTRLVAKYKGVEYSALVAADGRMQVQDKPDLPIFKSPSAAGSAVMGGIACNGWRFWSVEGQEPTASTESPPAASRPPRARKPRAFEPIKKHK